MMQGQCTIFPTLCLVVSCWCAVESVGLRSKVLRKVEELKAGCVCTGVPDEYLCPITRELMKDPVIAAGGTRPHGHLSFCLCLFSYQDSIYFYDTTCFAKQWHAFKGCKTHYPSCLPFLLDRWVLLWEGSDWELDRNQESFQPHDQPALTDNTSDPKPNPQDGYWTLEDQPVRKRVARASLHPFQSEDGLSLS